jgi:hypothetical protein
MFSFAQPVVGILVFAQPNDRLVRGRPAEVYVASALEQPDERLAFAQPDEMRLLAQPDEIFVFGQPDEILVLG